MRVRVWEYGWWFVFEVFAERKLGNIDVLILWGIGQRVSGTFKYRSINAENVKKCEKWAKCQRS